MPNIRRSTWLTATGSTLIDIVEGLPDHLLNDVPVPLITPDMGAVRFIADDNNVYRPYRYESEFEFKYDDLVKSNKAYYLYGDDVNLNEEDIYKVIDRGFNANRIPMYTLLNTRTNEAVYEVPQYYIDRFVKRKHHWPDWMK